MRKLWWFLRQEKNRQVLGWFGGGPLSSQVAFGPWLPSSTHPISPLRRRMSMLRRRGASAPVGISRLDNYGHPLAPPVASPSNPDPGTGR